jgi:hypothetical protein
MTGLEAAQNGSLPAAYNASPNGKVKDPEPSHVVMLSDHVHQPTASSELDPQEAESA